MNKRRMICIRGWAMVPFLLLLSSCDGEHVLREAELRGELEHQRDLTHELTLEIQRLEELEEKKERDEAAIDAAANDLPDILFSAVIEIQPVTKSEFRDAVLSDDFHAAILRIRNVELAEVLAGDFTFNEARHGSNFSCTSFIRSEFPTAFHSIAGKDPEENPELLPRQVSASLSPLLDLSLRVKGKDGNRLLVGVEVTSERALSPYEYPLAKIFKDKEPSTLSFERKHEARLDTSTLVTLGEAKYIGMLPGPPEDDTKTVYLVFLTITESEA